MGTVVSELYILTRSYEMKISPNQEVPVLFAKTLCNYKIVNFTKMFGAHFGNH
jgi:hypothetical protein